MQKTQDGFFTLIFMVLIACGVAWYNGWDKLALSYIETAINTGQEAKQNVQNQVEGVKTIMKNHDKDIFNEMGEDPATVQ